MNRPNYEIIDHTADIGIRVRGESLESLFQSAGAAFFDIIGTWGKPGDSHVLKVRLEAEAVADLFHDWLDELNFLHQTQDLVFFEFEIEKIREVLLEATVRGRKIDRTQDSLHLEIKAVTHHELNVEKKPDGWRAAVIFDI